MQPEIIAALDKFAKQEAAAEQNDNTLPVIKLLEPSQTTALYLLVPIKQLHLHNVLEARLSMPEVSVL